MISFFILQGNPFFDAYNEADLLGKAIFLLLILLSIICWSVLIHKVWLTSQVKKGSFTFRRQFFESKAEPLTIEYLRTDCPNAFGIIHDVVKNKALEIIAINPSGTKSLTQDDISLLETHAMSTISSLTKHLEKNLYILSTIVTLAPFVGLLGTVYGILTTFTQLQSTAMGGTMGGSNQAILGGLSLALAATVLGLIDAIPALIGYNYLKNLMHDFETEMQRFATDVLSTIELHYRATKRQSSTET